MKNKEASTQKQKSDSFKTKRIFSLTSILGSVLFIFGIGSLLYSYGPIFLAEIRYAFKHSALPTFQESASSEPVVEEVIIPVDAEFGIVIPKIEINVPIVIGVDPDDSQDYQRKLTKGVAQAKGTGLPGQDRTMFLFAHASGDLMMARRYNAVFYLLNKMEIGDEIMIYYQGFPYRYKVKEIKKVSANAVSYLKNDPAVDLILMTCTPPGTVWRRLLVIANLE